MLHRVGRKFVQSECEGLNEFESQGHRRNRNRYLAIGCSKRLQFQANNILQIDVVIHCAADKALYAAERRKPCKEPFQRPAFADGLLRDGLHDRKQIARPMLSSAIRMVWSCSARVSVVTSMNVTTTPSML